MVVGGCAGVVMCGYGLGLLVSDVFIVHGRVGVLRGAGLVRWVNFVV